ncbi:MAG: DNA methyltransferase [Anaerolineaceae bacterium]|nr:DNA methyltransferase [Anaerolineaceae bacterium]
MALRRELYRGDCLDILDQYIEKESVDLIYLDPPFNSKSTYNLPFRKKDKDLKPVEAFTDFWEWTIDDEIRLDEWKRSKREPLRSIATIVEFAYRVERKFEGGGVNRKYSLASYLINMAERLIALRTVLKDTGSIYLHCDPTASHYLKLLMDAIFGQQSFRNEIAWCYTGPSNTKRWYPRKHDTILFYSKGDIWTFNRDTIRVPYSDLYVKRFQKRYDEKAGKSTIFDGGHDTERNQELARKGKLPEDYWLEDRDKMSPVGRRKKERLGYPTQKPLALLNRIIKASSNPVDLILDPFCGCGTAIEAAEQLGRQWIGIDISRFSVGLMQERVVSRCHISSEAIKVFGLPETITEARELAKNEPFEFEKWAAGAIGANGLYKDLGRPGPDGGVDGVIEITTIQSGKVHDDTVIVQVKGGNVTPDSVKALSETVRRRGSKAGILLCFADQMGTVNNQRSRETWQDQSGTYPVIQGFAIEDMLAGERPKLPPMYGVTRGGRLTA